MTLPYTTRCSRCSRTEKSGSPSSPPKARSTGYAEDTWPQLLRDFANGELRPRYCQSPQLDLANRPFARRDLLPSHRYLTKDVFEATRGCVHSCEFCVVPTAWGRKPIQKPVAD